MPRVGFEFTIPVFEWTQRVVTLDYVATVMGTLLLLLLLLQVVVVVVVFILTGNRFLLVVVVLQ
jgi:hypothetical protein